ncbi:hypothetical protein MKW92_033951, partial [Papaver armeniacum]
MKVDIALEEGWAIIENEVTKQIEILEAGIPDDAEESWDIILNRFTNQFHISSSVDYVKVYNTVYTLCTQRLPTNYSKEVYERYEGVYTNYLKSKVLPSIQRKHDDVSMLHELVKRWEIYKVLVNKLMPYFAYLDRFCVPRHRLPTVKGAVINCFRKIIGEEVMKNRVKDAVISLINQEREGVEIDRTLIKNVLQIFVELGNQDDDKHNNMEYYVNGFETAFLNNTADYYTWKASNWTKEEYVVKAEECLQKEKERASSYLDSSTEEKLLKIVQD